VWVLVWIDGSRWLGMRELLVQLFYLLTIISLLDPGNWRLHAALKFRHLGTDHHELLPCY
jgi:hypothetical protein